MINFNVGNKSYSNNKYSNKTAGDHVYYIKRTNLGVTDSSFNIIDHGNNLPITVSLMVINSELPKDSTYVEVYLKIHNNTLSSMNSEKAVTVDASNVFLYVSSDKTLESFALVSYEIIEDHLANASILVPGSFVSSEDKSIDLLNNNGESNKYIMDGQWYKEWLAPLQSINILNRNLVSFPLGSTFALVRANEDIENAIGAGLNAVINVEFILNDSTILISGGQNYNINDTDFIVKMTGRYILNDDSEFMNTIKNLHTTNYECVIKYGAFYNPVNYKMNDCITGLIGMTCLYVKQIEKVNENECIEWNWAKVTHLIDNSKICLVNKLGINICPGCNNYFNV